MRALSQLLLSALIPALVSAQGSILPPRCPPVPCPPNARCVPCLPPRGGGVIKQSSHVRVELVDRVLRYEVTETFVNRGGGLGEADYIFPLPKGAAFQDLKLSINGELVSGETMSAERARGIYEEIVRRQRDPALVEWMGYGLLRARIFPIAPGEEKKVVVRFQMVAEREGDAVRVDYFQGKRTGQGFMLTDEARDGGSVRGSFTLAYPSDAMYGDAYSPTHKLAVIRRGQTREVRVTGSASEITLLVPVRGTNRAAISVLAHARRGEDGFALVTLSPPAMSQRVTPRDVTLVLDVSGSMSGVKIRQARAAGKQLLATLNADDRFMLIDFATDVRSFRDGFVRATAGNISQASRYLESLDASGSTNISGALDRALDGDTPAGRLGLVLFVTDGEPTVGERSPEAIAERVSRKRGERRIFSFGVGADLNAALIERLAMEGKGTAHFVRPEESVERAVSIVASRLSNPVVTDLRVSAEGVRLMKRHPSESADVFAGQDFVMLARYSGSGSTRIRFQGRTANGPVTWESRVEFPRESRDNAFVARLWATQRVGYLTAEKRRNGGSGEVDAEIRELGEQYGIPTEFTSYLVLEPGMQAQVGNAASSVGRDRAVPTAVAAAAPPSAKAFEATRAAAEQRAATSLAAIDEADFAKSADGAKRVGSRTFMLRGETWTDTQLADSTRKVKVRPYSAAYFRLIELIPDLREIFAIGDRVIVAGKSVAIEVSESGVESLSDAEMNGVQRGW